MTFVFNQRKQNLYCCHSFHFYEPKSGSNTFKILYSTAYGSSLTGLVTISKWLNSHLPISSHIQERVQRGKNRSNSQNNNMERILTLCDFFRTDRVTNAKLKFMDSSFRTKKKSKNSIIRRKRCVSLLKLTVSLRSFESFFFFQSDFVLDKSKLHIYLNLLDSSPLILYWSPLRTRVQNAFLLLFTTI